jgi:hypothetical protein
MSDSGTLFKFESSEPVHGYDETCSYALVSKSKGGECRYVKKVSTCIVYNGRLAVLPSRQPLRMYAFRIPGQKILYKEFSFAF